jgi:sporulation protein YunB
MERLGLTKKWKKIKINKSHKRLLIFILIVFIIPITLLEMITSLIKPTLMALCEINARSLGVTISNRVVTEMMENIGYLDLITLERDNSGNIKALKANVIEMNKLSAKIGLEIQKEYNELGEVYISIPLGNFTGNELLAGLGPKATIKIIPVGNVVTTFKTEFLSTGINQTRHRVYLEILNRVRIVAPLIINTSEIVTTVNVAETVLVGDVPDSFYNLEGLEGANVQDTLNLWNP